VTREHKLALIVGFALILVVGVFVSDHFSKARIAKPEDRLASSAGMPARDQRPPIAYPAPTPLPEPVAAAPAHQPGVFVTGERPRLDGSAGDIAGADRGVPGFSPAGSGELRPNTSPNSSRRDYVPAVMTVDVAGEGSVPIVGPQGRDPRTGAPAITPKTTPMLPVSTGELRRHTVTRGDSLAKIANRYYGDEKLWRRLAEYNGPRVGANAGVNQGVTLLVPPRDVLIGQATLAPEGAPRAPRTGDQASAARKPVAAKPGAKKPEAPKVVERTYTVKSGDTLALIAERELGSGKRWREIQKLNAAVLDDEDTIAVGMVLKLPAGAPASKS